MTKISSEYIFGYSLEKVSLRKYKHIILDGEKIGKIFYSETSTPRIDFYTHGEGQTIFYGESTKEYKTAQECIDNL